MGFVCQAFPVWSNMGLIMQLRFSNIRAACLRSKAHAAILALSLATGLLAAFAPLTATAATSWSDSFETYAAGSQMHGQGGWKGWDNVAAAGALVAATPVRTGTRSVAIASNSDLVQEYTFATSGKWIYTAWQFIPTNFAGKQYFVLMNTYQAGGSQLWSAQVWMDTGIGKVGSDFDGAKLPLVKGRWVELRVEIDLTADVQKFYYDNQFLYQKSWTAGVSGSGARSIAAVDLYANGTSAVYYDDISLQSMNQAPVAQNQSVTNAEDTTKAITLIATDADNDALTYTIVANPAHGTLSGTFSNVTYTPATNYNGSDSFTFRVSDGKTNSNVATVSLTVTPVNDAPTVIASASPTNGTAPLAVNFTAIGMDVDGDPLTYSWTFGDDTTASIQNPSHSYTTAGSYTATVTVSDGNGGYNSTLVVFTLTSGPPSITLQPSDVIVATGQTATFTVAASGAAPMYYQWYKDSQLLAGATGTTYTTPLTTTNDVGDWYFHVVVCNLGGTVVSDEATLSVALPTVALPVAFCEDVTVYSNTAETITLYGAKFDPTNGLPIPGVVFTYCVVVTPTNGTLSALVSNEVTYTPFVGYVGPDQFTYKVNDGFADSEPAVIAITVTNVIPGPPPPPTNVIPPNVTHGVPPPVITPFGGTFSDPLLVTIAPPTLTPISGTPGWRTGVRFPGAGLEQTEALSHDGLQVMALRARTVCSNMYTFASVNLSPEAGAPIPLYVWSLTDFGTANYPPDLLIGVTDNLGWDGNSRSISSSSNSNRVYLMFRQNTHGSGAASPELYSCAAGLSMTLSSQNLATFDPLVMARLGTEPLRFEYAGDKVRVTVNGQPLTCAATDENGWVTYIGDAASGRVTAPLGATRFWVSLAGGYMKGQRELVLADWAKPETRYTFDNSAVTETSPLVPGPLRLTYDTTLRARCFSSPLPGSVETSAVFTCAIQPFPAESYISPVYLPIDYAPLDGSTPQISVTGPSGTVQAGPAQDLRYPLDSAAPTPLTLHRSGAPDVSGSVVWRALDLGNAPDMHICRDDSLLLTAGTLGQTGTLQIEVLDSSNQIFRTIASAEGERTPVLFNREGIFHATAYISGVSVGSLTIFVSYVDIKGPIACQLGYTREKYIIVQAPSNEVFFTANVPALLNVGVKALTAQGVTLRLTALQRGSPVLQVRLGSPTGPVVAQQPVDEFTLDSSAVPGIIVVDDSETGIATLRMRPYIPGIRFDFSMFASSSTFYGGVRSYSINTSDATAPTSEPGFQTEYDPNTGETVGVFSFTLEVPANENSYCFSSNPFQIDAALPGSQTAVTVGANNNNNGCKCTIIALNTLTFMNSTSDESPSKPSTSSYVEPKEVWTEQARAFKQIGANTCNPPPTYYITLTPAGAQNDEKDDPKLNARFANGTQISPTLQCLSGCQSLAYWTGTKYGIYTKTITVDSSKVKLPIDPCKSNNTPGKVDVSVDAGKLVVARLDANGILTSPAPGTRDEFPQYVEMMPKRSGKLFTVSNISGTPTLVFVGEPVIIVTSGGEDAGFGTPSLYGVECGNHTWEFQAQDDLATIPANLQPSDLSWEWSVNGAVEQIKGTNFTKTLPAGRHIVKLEYLQYGPGGMRPPALLAKAEIHSIVVEPKHSDNVDPVAAAGGVLVKGQPFEMRGKCFRGMKMDASLHVDAHTRVSLDGYPQNEYWGGVSDDKDLAQVLPLTHDQPRTVYLQGYRTPSASASDKATLSVKGQGLRESCAPDTCNNQFVGKQVEPIWEAADTEKFLVIDLDLDTDSDNNDGFGPPSRDPILEDTIEDYSTLPGKVVGVNDDDSDADGIPDFADGFDWDGWSWTAAQQKDDTSVNDRFVQLILEAPQPIDLSVARLRISYNASDPAGVTKSGTPAVWQPAGGSLRIWKKDANQARNKKAANAFFSPGDYVPSGVYKGSELGLSGSTRIVTLYVEGIKKSTTLADQQIKVEVDPDGSGTAVYMALDAVRCTVLKVDLDVDSNMDGNPDNDDAQEMDMRGIIIDVNNDSDATGDAIDNQNGTIDGAADKAELTPLWLRKVVALPTGWKVKLKVSDRSKLRIFDDTDAAIIGPVAADGGPDTDEFEVPLAKITAGDLKYLIEGFNYEHVTNALVICDSAGNEICRDEVRTVINVDRKPEDPANSGYQPVRNYVNLRKAVTKLEGVEAKLEGNKPLISWNKPRATKTTSFWVSVQKNDISSWLQTGVRVIRNTAGSESEEHYFEFVPNYFGWKNGTDPLGYQIFTKPGGTWASGTFRVEITDRTTGKAEAFYNGSSWNNQTHANFMTTQFDNYQAGSEPKQSVARQPGSSATHAKVSEARYKDDTGWHDTSFAASDVRISVTDGKGVVSTVSATASGASVFEYHAKWIDGRTFEMWDSRDW
jgi:PKD repeat protein